MILSNDPILNTGRLAGGSIHNVYKKMESKRTDEMDGVLKSFNINIENNQNKNKEIDSLECIIDKLSF